MLSDIQDYWDGQEYGSYVRSMENNKKTPEKRVSEKYQNSPLCECTRDETRPSDEAIWYEHLIIC